MAAVASFNLRVEMSFFKSGSRAEGDSATDADHSQFREGVS